MTVHFIKTMQVRRAAMWISLVLITAVAACGEAPSAPPRVSLSPILQKAGQVAANREVVAAVAGRTERGAEGRPASARGRAAGTRRGLLRRPWPLRRAPDGCVPRKSPRLLARRRISPGGGWEMRRETPSPSKGDAGIVIQPAQYRFSTLVAWHSKVRAALPIPGASVSALMPMNAVIGCGWVLLTWPRHRFWSRSSLALAFRWTVLRSWSRGTGTAASDLRDYKRPTGAGIQIARNVNGLDYVCSRWAGM